MTTETAPVTPRYSWELAVEAHGHHQPEDSYPYGKDTAIVSDGVLGGAIAYVHEAFAPTLTATLNGRPEGELDTGLIELCVSTTTEDGHLVPITVRATFPEGHGYYAASFLQVIHEHMDQVLMDLLKQGDASTVASFDEVHAAHGCDNCTPAKPATEPEEPETMTVPRHTCPRRIEDGRGGDGGPFVGAGDLIDEYKPGHGIIGQGRGCSYCGSMHPDDFMEAMREGAELGTTSKNYKAYVRGYKNDGANGGKFYFQHLTTEQRHEFITLLNERKVNFGAFGGFTVMPFFIGAAK